MVMSSGYVTLGPEVTVPGLAEGERKAVYTCTGHTDQTPLPTLQKPMFEVTKAQERVRRRSAGERYFVKRASGQILVGAFS